MNNARVHVTTRRPPSPMTIGPLRSGMAALAVASLLFVALAVCHDDSPVARLIAERTTAESGVPNSIPSASPERDRINTFVATPSVPLNSISSISGRRSLEPAQHSAEHLAARSKDESAHFLTASQSHRTNEHGPEVHLGPPQVSAEARDAGHSTSKPTAESGPLVTRTYRPVSMSAISLERLVRPLLTGHGAAVASNAALSNEAASNALPPVAMGHATDATRVGVAETAGQPDMLVVSDRPEAIGRIDALCRDLESHSPRIAIDLVVVSVMPSSGSQLPWNQWRQNFGIVDSDLASVLNTLRGLGRASVRARSQLQTISGSWTELTCGEQSLVAPTSRPDADEPEDRTSTDGSANSSALPAARSLTTLHVRPTSQADGIRLEVRAQSSHTESRAPTGPPQLITVRFNTEVLLHEGSTGIVNLFVDEPLEPLSSPTNPIHAASTTLVIPGGPSIPVAKIVPHPGSAEQTLLLLMPRLVDATCPVGKIAASKTHNPS
jgi:hypothetical protein